MSRLRNGGLIDRSQALRFNFDGKPYQGFAGDTLASALLANDVRLIGRSFKYHRPRGVLTAGPEEPNALVTLHAGARATPSTRATCVELCDGLIATSQNRWPSLNVDLMAATQVLAPLFVAGFYYKTFMWPAALWERLYEPAIRRAAGLGALSGHPDPDHYDRAHAFCDLLIVGAGPAGLSAALTATRAGLRVILTEEDWLIGGRLLSDSREIDGAPAIDWVDAAKAELTAAPNLRILNRTSVFGAYDGGVFGAVERIESGAAPAIAPQQRYWKIVAKHAVLSTGATERPLIFGGNDRPGIMLASAVSTYLNRFGVAPGAHVAVFTSSDSGWETVSALRAADVDVVAVIDARQDQHADAAAARKSGVAVYQGAVVTDTQGSKHLETIWIRTAEGHETPVSVDLLAMAGGWSPALGLGCHFGARPTWSEPLQAYVLTDPPSQMRLVGAAAGRFSLAAALDDGARAARDIAQALGRSSPFAPPPRCDDEPSGVSPLLQTARSKRKAFVDFQNDVTVKDVALAAREGFVSVEHMKRYTTLGMATDQGKTSQALGNALLARETGKTMAEVGTILARPPHNPVTIGALAGHHRDEHFRPERRTATHEWSRANGAPMVDAGHWKRAQWHPLPGETDWLTSVTREARAVRTSVGVCDVSTLGKIDVHGPDAGILLDRLYINTFSNLPIGRARYGVMLREDGFVMDDGTTTRFAADRYFVTTTTANAAKVMQHIDFCRQVLWPELDVQAVSVTEQWAQFAVAGPHARALLQEALPQLDLANAAFPFMAACEWRWNDLPARLYRISFSGELAYEIAVPAAYGAALHRALMEAGEEFNVTPYGVDALSVLRIEKGHPAGAELNGQTTAFDLGLARLMSKKKDFIGRTLAARAALVDPERLQLVGVRPLDPRARVRAGAHLLPRDAPEKAAHDQGFLTSTAFCPALNSWIGLALVRRGPARLGERLRAFDPVRGGDTLVEICSPVFVDPEGTRVRG